MRRIQDLKQEESLETREAFKNIQRDSVGGKKGEKRPKDIQYGDLIVVIVSMKEKLKRLRR